MEFTFVLVVSLLNVTLISLTGGVGLCSVRNGNGEIALCTRTETEDQCDRTFGRCGKIRFMNDDCIL